MIKDVLKEGDVINFEGIDYSKKKFFDKIASWFVNMVIQADQRYVFGKWSNWKDHHSALYLGEDMIFSVEPPKPKFLKLKDILSDKVILTVYRYTEKNLGDWDIKQMIESANMIIGYNEKYDVGQLMDILVDTIAGYPHAKKWRLFDFGRSNMVCSVGVASVYNYRRHRLWQVLQTNVNQLFNVLNPSAWSKGFIKRFEKKGYWDIDRTTPANFANSKSHFRGEFERVGVFLNGNPI